MSDQTGRPGQEQPAPAAQPTAPRPEAHDPAAQQPVGQESAAPQAAPGQPAPQQQAAGGAPGPEQSATWGAPAPERTAPRWSWRKTAAATAVAVAVAVGGGFAVYAAGNATADQRGGPGGMRGGPGGMVVRGAVGGPMGALHGEFVASDGNGGYETKLVQTGEVTAISDTSITAKSADGFTKTYVIDADTVKTAVETGDQVVVLATASGDTATAESVSEGDVMGGPGARGGALPGGPGQGVPPRRDDTGDQGPNGGGTPPGN
ncbi:hypothetical protein L6E12_11340 [Actinokineospora sp. PR83]|uniref:hypothetical protein n=1 Tax=Actinokineospora sp. PR83 TaxID=2884908 RepID=UPI001F4503C7|nr:hypothetical protein [Actinokineospora sp. PR83]MCG8916383.1 hypothetical protein [Actinokineospora sp. PR83]